MLVDEEHIVCRIVVFALVISVFVHALIYCKQILVIRIFKLWLFFFFLGQVNHQGIVFWLRVSLLLVLFWLVLLVAKINLVDHRQLCILLTDELLGEVELFNEHPLQLHHDVVVAVLVLEVSKERILRLNVSSDQKSDANEECLFKHVVIFRVLDVFA